MRSTGFLQSKQGTGSADVKGSRCMRVSSHGAQSVLRRPRNSTTACVTVGVLQGADGHRLFIQLLLCCHTKLNRNLCSHKMHGDCWLPELCDDCCVMRQEAHDAEHVVALLTAPAGWGGKLEEAEVIGASRRAWNVQKEEIPSCLCDWPASPQNTDMCARPYCQACNQNMAHLHTLCHGLLHALSKACLRCQNS